MRKKRLNIGTEELPVFSFGSGGFWGKEWFRDWVKARLDDGVIVANGVHDLSQTSLVRCRSNVTLRSAVGGIFGLKGDCHRLGDEMK